MAYRSLAGQGEPVEEVARLAMQAAAASPETASMQATIGFLETLALGLAGHLRPARERARQVRERPGEFAATFGALYEGRVAFHAGQPRPSARRPPSAGCPGRRARTALSGCTASGSRS